jgi:hypothetical protein
VSRFVRKGRERGLLTRIRSRNVSVIDSITPEIASETIRLYILPMLGANHRAVLSRNRAEQFGTTD